MEKVLKIAEKPNLILKVELNGFGMTSARLFRSKDENGFFCHFEGETTQHLEESIIAWLKAYSSGHNVPLPTHFFSNLPSFTVKILNKLKEIPFAETITYQTLAHSVGSTQGARAAGGACGRNPLLIFVPCHRVIRSTGELGGFSEGLEFKKQLLEFESQFRT